MSGPVRRTTRWVLGWCRAYTRLAPAGPAARRREELAAHLLDEEGVVAGPRLLGAAVRGVAADLQWCQAARRRAGMRSLGAALAAHPATGFAVAASLVAGAVVASWFESAPGSAAAVASVTLGAASAPALLWAYVAAALRRRTGSGSGRGPGSGA